MMTAPDRACACGAKFDVRGFFHRAPHRTSFFLNCQGQPTKKGTAVAILALFSFAPDRACAAGAKFDARGFHHSAPRRTSFLLNCQGQPTKKWNRRCDSFPLPAPYRLELTTLRLTAECSTICRGLDGKSFKTICNYFLFIISLFGCH